jgi:transposase
VDSVIREQVRVRELEDGLAVILEREPDSWERRRLVEFVDGVRAGKAVAQIALEAKVSAATVERGLREVRNARIAAEAEQLASPGPENKLNDGRGTKLPVLIEGENNRGASP